MYSDMTEADWAQDAEEKAWMEAEQRLDEELNKGKPGFAEYFRWMDEMVADPDFSEPYND